MLSKRNLFFLTVVTVFIMSVFFSSTLFAADVTIIGEVDDQSQIVSTDGEVYLVADNDVGLKIVTEHISEMVKVTGTVKYSDDDDMMIITAKRFEVMYADDVGEPDDEEYED